mmetsp:Transcript_62181/g.166852  ORF Transcript_62181/g.166852 Transcript_62181/m.166852 type:complete len:283 (-) Transcript_62181:26-874(-)
MVLHRHAEGLLLLRDRRRLVNEGAAHGIGLRRRRSDGLSSAVLVRRLVGRLVGRRRVAVHLVVSQLENHLQAPVEPDVLLLQVSSAEPWDLENVRVVGVDELVGGDARLLHCRLNCGGQRIGEPDRGRFALGRSFREQSGLDGVLAGVVEISKDGHTITPRVLEVDASLAIRRHDKLEALVEPTVLGVSVQHEALTSEHVVSFLILQAHDENGRIDFFQSRLVSRNGNKRFTGSGPCIAVQSCKQAKVGLILGWGRLGQDCLYFGQDFRSPDKTFHYPQIVI